jgi:hypothetical protein
VSDETPATRALPTEEAADAAAPQGAEPGQLVPESEARVIAEPEAGPQVEAGKPDPQVPAEPEPQPESEPEPEAQPESELEVQPEAKPEPQPEPQPEPSSNIDLPTESGTAPEPVSADAPDAASTASSPVSPAEVEPPQQVTGEVPTGAPASPAEPEADLDARRPEPPKPRPIPRPAPPRGAAGVTPTTRPIPIIPPANEEEEREAATFGRVDENGVVYVREGSHEREVGQFPGVPEAEALALYVRRYLDLKAQLALFEARIESLTIREMDQNLSTLKQALLEPAAVGNIHALREHLGRVRDKAGQARARIDSERKAAKEEALAARTAIAAKAEELAAIDPQKIQWRQTWDQFKQLLDDWKSLQKEGPRVDHAAEDELWKRISKARAALERKRRQHFTELEKRYGTAKATKEQIVTEARKLVKSQDWGATSAAFRGLMDRWRDAGRTNRQDDETLWEAFQAARDEFFTARDSHFQAADSQQRSNLDAKLAVIAEAEALLPIKDLQAAKATMRRLQDRFDQIGHVPRGEMSRVEARIKAVEDAIRAEEDKRWKRSNPEARARSRSMATQLEATIAELRTQLLEAQAAKDTGKIASVREALAAREAWLDQVLKSADDFD